MKNLIYAICFVLISSSLIFSQVRQAHVSFYGGDMSGNSFGSFIKTDKDGNYFVAGRSTGFNTNLDYAVIKYSPNGDLLWERRFNGEVNGNDEPLDLFVDIYGNSYVTGYSMYSIVSKSFECVTIKYSPNGETLWINKYRANPNTNSKGNSVKVHDNGDVFVAGYVGTSHVMDFFLQKIDQNGKSLWTNVYNVNSYMTDYVDKLFIRGDYIYLCGGATLNSITNLDYVIFKLNMEGRIVWRRTYNGEVNGTDIAKSVFVDKDENVYITGYTETRSSKNNITSIKYNSNGDVVWVTDFGGTAGGYDWSNHILVDDFGNAYVAGGTQNERKTHPECYSELGECRNDATLIKYLPTGEIDWVRLYNGPDNMYDCFQGLALDKNNNIYVAGRSKNRFINGNDDMITLKYNTRGDVIWYMRYNSGPTSYDYGNAIAVDDFGNVYTSGFSELNGVMVFKVVKYSRDDVAHDNISNVAMNNHPNPFNPVTKINFTLSTANVTSLKVFNSLGQEVTTLVNGQLNPGYHEYTFDASGLASGVYFYRLEAGEFVETKRMLLVK